LLDNLSNNYNVLYTITFGSPLIRLGEREGTVTRLNDWNDPVPGLSLQSVIFLPYNFTNLENAHITDPIRAHLESYRMESVWGQYDALGKKGGSAYFHYDPDLVQFYRAPTDIERTVR
jgi:hypothetical protein